MRVVVAHRTVDFAQNFHGFDLLDLAFQARHHVGHFFAQGSGRCGLAVGTRQHRQGGVIVRQLADVVGDFLHNRQHDIAAGSQHQTMRQVVDVFGGAGEMHKLVHGHQLGVAGEFLFDEVFHRFHVVVGGGFNLFDAQGVCFAEVVDDGIQRGGGGGRKRRYFMDTGVCSQALQPADFHFHPGTD